MRRAVYLWVLLMTGGQSLNAKPIHDASSRSERILKTLTVLRSSDLSDLDDTRSYLTVMERNSCRSNFERLRVECLLQAARKNCLSKRGTQRDDCFLYSDILVVNLLSEDSFITNEERFHIMKHHRDYRAHIREALDRSYAALTVDFVVSKFYRCEADDFSCLSSAIDAFCFDCAERRNLSWQYCVSALVWPIGTGKN